MKSAFRAALALAFSVSVCVAQAPVNDECTGALALAIGVNPAPAASGNFYTSVNSTTGSTVAACQASNSDVWFSFTPTMSGDYTFSTNTPIGYTAGTLTNTVLSVYDACPPVNELGCDNDNGAASRSAVKVAGLLSGLTYYVRVAKTVSVATGTFYLTVIPSVTNDECAGAPAVSIGTAGPFTNEGATDSAGITSVCPHPAIGTNSDVWFAFTAPANGTYEFSTDTPSGFGAGSMIDTALSVWNGCGPSMSEIGCADDGGIVGTMLSVATVSGLIGGNVYYVRVADFQAGVIDQGTFYLTIKPKFEMFFSSPLGAGSLKVDILNGPPNGNYFLGVSLIHGAYPQGWFFGLDIGLQEVTNQVNTGYPFLGPLSAAGAFTVGPFPAGSLPPGLHLYAVALAFNSGLGTPDKKTPPMSYVIP